MRSQARIRILSYSLGALQLFIGITAVLGGFGLVSDPSGVTAKTPLEWLKNSPFENYLVPGLILIIVIGGSHLFGGVFSFSSSSFSPIITATCGIVLVLFMSMEIWFIGLRNLMQPLYLVLGAILVFLCLKQRRLMKKSSRPLSSADQPLIGGAIG